MKTFAKHAFRRSPANFLLCFLVALAFYSASIPAAAALLYVEGPKEGERIVRTSVSESASSFAPTQPKDIQIARPIRKFDMVNFKDVISGKLLSSVVAVEWSYLLLAKDKAVGSVDLRESSKSGSPPDLIHLVSPRYGGDPVITNMIAAFKLAEQLPQVKNGNYEVRLLDLKALDFAGVWLHGQDSDLIVPLKPFPSTSFPILRAYTEVEVAKQLEPRAKLGNPKPR